jgi:hypothetical protein
MAALRTCQLAKGIIQPAFSLPYSTTGTTISRTVQLQIVPYLKNRIQIPLNLVLIDSDIYIRTFLAHLTTSPYQFSL